MRLLPGVLAVVLLTIPLTAVAQTDDGPRSPYWSRFFVDTNLTGGVVSIARDRQFTSRFVTFGELGSSLASYPKPSHPDLFPLLDLGGGVMITRTWGLGVSYSRTRYEDVVALTTTIPHPTVLNAPATASGATAEALARKEAATHVFLVGIVPIPLDRAELRLAGGPSFFSYRADMVGAVLYAQSYDQLAPANSITISGIDTREVRGSDIGLHVSVDFTYFFTKAFGVGTGARFSRATIDVEEEPLSGLSQTIRAGSAVGFVGVRFRFGH